MEHKAAIIIVLVLTLLVLPGCFAQENVTLSNASAQASQAIDAAKRDIAEMQSRNISLNRVNSLLEQTMQLYSAQVALEQDQGKADYSLVFSNTDEINKIKGDALIADDQLEVFNDYYQKISHDTNLSAMDKEYNDIQKSFTDERFEETPGLIDAGYKKISELQASQTALKVFYDTTSRSIKSFFVDNWKKILIIVVIIILLFIVLSRSIKQITIKRKVKKLEFKRAALGRLIKNLQKSYFGDRKISETEYTTKMEKFKEMIRDVDRQIPLLKEDLMKIDYKK